MCLILDSRGIVICTLVMALRVLLADESTTIKKVLQLALADFGIEVKSVPSGIDVITVAQDFHPDIIFADILLTKKNGYEVCGDLKKHPQLKNIPVVLMWSSFMEFNEKLAQKLGYNGQLEKPFDTEALRSLVERLVTKTTTHPLKGLLEFPSLPDFVESETFIRQKNEFQSNKNIETVDENFSGNTVEIDEDVSDLNEFKPLDLKQNNSKNSNQNQEPQEIHLETENFGEFEEVVLVKTEKNHQDLEDKIQSQLKNYIQNSPVALNKVTKAEQAQGDKPKSMTRFEEQLLREEARTMAEKICWQLIPEITEKIVREELKKLLNDIEKSI